LSRKSPSIANLFQSLF